VVSSSSSSSSSCYLPDGRAHLVGGPVPPNLLPTNKESGKPFTSSESGMVTPGPTKAKGGMCVALAGSQPSRWLSARLSTKPNIGGEKASNEPFST